MARLALLVTGQSSIFYIRNVQQINKLHDERIFQDLMNARTGPEIISAIHDANLVQEASGAETQAVQITNRLPQLQQLVIQPGKNGDVLTHTQYILSKLYAEEKLKKSTSGRLISMIKRRDFVIE
jgi:hypothetical protein